MKFSYILLALCLLILILPVSAGTAQLGWYNDTEGGGCVTAVDTNDDGTLVIAGYWNGNITAYNMVVNVSNSSASGTVAWRYRTNTSITTTTNNTIKKMIADVNGNIVWMTEREVGYISSSGAVGSQKLFTQNCSDIALRADSGAYAVTLLRSGTTPSQIIIYQTGGTLYARNTSFGTNVNWTAIGYDPNNQWIVTANESSNRLYYWNITGWFGWEDFNPTHTASKNSSQQFLDTFPHRMTLNLTPSTGAKGIFFQNTSAVTMPTKINTSYYQYNSAYTGQYFYWTINNNLSNTPQSGILNMSIINGSGVNTNYSVMVGPGQQNYTIYYGNLSYSYNYIEQDNHYTTTDGAYTVLVWNTTGNYSWRVPSGATSVEYLVVGGGGGGGSGLGGGGGGGGQVVTASGYKLVAGDTINIQVAGLRTNSSFGNTTVIVRAKNATDGYPGVGSGGNAGNGNTGGGGYYEPYDGYYCGGGGGGNGANGGNAVGWGGGCSPGGGGAGTSSSITGTTITYGAGGGGGSFAAGANGNTVGIVAIRFLGGTPPLYFGEVPTTSSLGADQSRQISMALNQSSIHDYVGNINGISVPSTGALASISTDTIFYQQYILPSGFDTFWCATYPLGGYVLYPGVVHDVESSNGGSASISARGNYGNVYDASAILRATLLTGSIIQSADSAMSSGIFAAFGGDAGIIYMFSKESSPNWYTYYTGGIASPIKSVGVAWNGECVVVGRGDGRFEYYITNISITPAPTPSYVDAQVRVFKDSTVYANQPVTVYSSTSYNPYVWAPAGTSYTDGGGVFSYTTTVGTYYRFVVNNAPGTTSGEGEAIWQSNTASTIVQIFIISASTPYEWNAYYNTASNNVTVVYSDTITPTSVIVSIKDLKTNLVVLTHTYTTPSFTLEYHDQLGNGTYQVSIIINRLGSSVRDQRTVMSPNTYGTILPNDQYITWAISTFVLMLIAGMFSYSNSKRGALAVVVVAVIMMIFKLLPWGLMTVAMLAAIFAVMSLFASRVQ